jgi:hypothetical protein
MRAIGSAGRKGTTAFFIALLASCLATDDAAAEPYLAVYKGMQCSSCHSHPAGGGKRTEYGNAFAQTEMPAARVGAADADLWTGQVTKWLSVGGNLRADYRYVDTPDAEALSEFSIARGTVYVEAELIPARLSVYVDQLVAPGGAVNREAYVRLNSESGTLYLAAGQFFLPYGLRLQDDTAYVRQFTGIHFINPDRGVQLGYENGPWSTQVSVTNGTGGGAETDTGKQLSWVAQYVRQGWRVGASFNFNDADAGERQMQNGFISLRTGPVVWLAEADLIIDDLPTGGERNGIATLLEGNWLFRQGHNLKFGYDWFDPDDDLDGDARERWNLVWEYTPMQFLQGRIGVRINDGDPQFNTQNQDEYFAEIHGFF